MNGSRVTAIGMVLVLVFAVPAVAHDPAADLDNIRKELAELDSKIDRSRAESRKVADQIEAADAQVEQALAQVLDAQSKVDAKQAEIDVAQARIDELNGQRLLIESNLAATRAQLVSTAKLLETQAVEMYMSATTGSSTMMMAVADGTDITVGLAYLERLTGLSEDLLDTFVVLRNDEQRQEEEVKELRAMVDAQLQILETERAVLATDLDAIEAVREQAEVELASAQRLLAKIRADIGSYEQHQDSLKEDAARLQRELIERQQKGGKAPGVLAWPVDGRVTSPFGYRIHPIFGTSKLHTGIDISASSGTPIGAAAGGTVLIAGPYGGYGNAVVIDHGGGLATLYAHQSKVAVSVGATVTSGQTIGYVGCTGFCTGPHLHFETRESGVPVDPMKYLGG